MVQPYEYSKHLDELYSQYVASSADTTKSTPLLVTLLEELSLDDTKQWLNGHSKERQSLSQLLPQLDPPMISAKVCKVYQSLLQSEPVHNGTLVSLYLPDSKLPVAQLPRNLLSAQCSVFARQLNESSKMNAKEKQEIHLQGQDSAMLTQFIHYLQTGSVSLTGDTVLQLHALADFYGCSGLTRNCENYLLNHAQVQDLPQLLSYAITRNAPSLMNLCKILIWDNQAAVKNSLKLIPVDHAGLQEWQKELLMLVQKLPKLPDNWEYRKGRLTIADTKESKLWKNIPEFKAWGVYALDFKEKKAGHTLEAICQKIVENGLQTQLREVVVNLPHLSDQEYKALLQLPALTGFANRANHPASKQELETYLKAVMGPKKLAVLGLDLRKYPGCDEALIKQLFAISPAMRFLAIASKELKTLSCSDSLLELQCSDCPNLTTLYAPNALDLECRHCYLLEKIVAPNAVRKEIRHCPLLQNVSS